jgi:hypothetical protein
MSAKRGRENVIELNVKRAHLGDANPGKEYVEPRIYQQPVLNYGDQHQVAGRVVQARPAQKSSSPRSSLLGDRFSTMD